MKIAAIYSRVSSDKQKEGGTIDSQTTALVEFAKDKGFEVPDKWIFQDDGYSGANLVRPGLERVRDLAAEGQIQAVLIHSPDRLSRKYAYQVLLIEELARHGVEAIFIKSPQSETPEDQLLLQFQGMMAEYERAQIQERTRRGKIHRAKQGNVSVLSGAPYGYRYIKKTTDIPAYYEIIESEAEVVRKIFELYTVDGLSIGAIRRQLEQLGHFSPTKRTCWVRSTLSRMLSNSAYKGTACFGKTVYGPCSRKITRCNRLRGGVSIHGTKAQRPSEEWIEISVPPIINEDTFAIAQELRIRNKKLAARKTLRPSILQGLVYCQKCAYTLTLISMHLPTRKNRYYRCIGSLSWHHPHKKAVCDQKSIRQDVLDEIVWDEVIRLIENPTLIQAELDRRLEEAQNSPPTKKRQETLNLELIRVQKSMERLLSAYQEDLLSLDELRARLPELRQREKIVKTELQSATTQAENNVTYLKLAETLSAFQSRLHDHAETLDILERQKIVRQLVREIAVGDDKIIIRHSIPGHQFSGKDNGSPSNSYSPSKKEDSNTNYLLCPSRPDRIVGHICRDATEIEAREKAVPPEKKEPATPKKRGRPKKGESRPLPSLKRLQRQVGMSLLEMLADLPKACDVGSKKNSKGSTHSWRGYKLHIDTADGDIPISALLTSASVHDSQVSIPLSCLTEQRITYCYELMDAAYDAQGIRDYAAARGHVALIDFNRRSSKDEREFAPHEKERYKHRSSSERVNSTLKDNYGARFVRVRGHAKVMAHLMFGLLALTIDQTLRLLT